MSIHSWEALSLSFGKSALTISGRWTSLPTITFLECNSLPADIQRCASLEKLALHCILRYFPLFNLPTLRHLSWRSPILESTKELEGLLSPQSWSSITDINLQFSDMSDGLSTLPLVGMFFRHRFESQIKDSSLQTLPRSWFPYQNSRDWTSTLLLQMIIIQRVKGSSTS